MGIRVALSWDEIRVMRAAGAPEMPADQPRGEGPQECSDATQENELLNSDENPETEIAAILAVGYLRMLLASAQDPRTPDVCGTSRRKECTPSAHEGLEVPERKSVHVSRD